MNCSSNLSYCHYFPSFSPSSPSSPPPLFPVIILTITVITITWHKYLGWKSHVSICSLQKPNSQKMLLSYLLSLTLLIMSPKLGIWLNFAINRTGLANVIKKFIICVKYVYLRTSFANYNYQLRCLRPIDPGICLCSLSSYKTAKLKIQ